MDPAKKQVSTKTPLQNQPFPDISKTTNTRKPYHGRKLFILESFRINLNRLINWLSKPLKNRKIKIHFSQNEHFSRTEFNRNCTALLIAIAVKRNKKLPELLSNLRLSIPAAIPHKNEREIESSDIIELFESWSAQCTNPAIVKYLRKDLLNPSSNIRKIWTAEQALMAEVMDFSPQTLQRLKDIEALIGQLATALLPETIKEVMEDVRSHEDRMKSSPFYQKFAESIII